MTKIEEICWEMDTGSEDPSKEYKAACTSAEKMRLQYEETVEQLEQALPIQEALIEENRSPRPRNSVCQAPICISDKSTFLGGRTNWVQCDKCDAWFHHECCLIIGAKKKKEVNEKAWFCSNCEKEKTPFKAGDVLKKIDHLVKTLKNDEAELKIELETVSARRDLLYSVIKERLGPRTSAFNEALSRLGVDRQQYHAGVITGDHVYKMATGDGPDIITQCLGGTPELDLERAIFKNCLTLLGRIMGIMGLARFLTDEEINQLKEMCHDLGVEYEKFSFREYTITPKMHMLVNHVPVFAETFGSVGFFSEHGFEHIHAYLNNVGRRFACLRSMGPKFAAMYQHHTTQRGALYRMRKNVWKGFSSFLQKKK